MLLRRQLVFQRHFRGGLGEFGRLVAEMAKFVAGDSVLVRRHAGFVAPSACFVVMA
jgi:hypothetical protein